MNTGYHELSDEELVIRAHKEEQAAVDVLLDRYKGFVRTLTKARYLAGGDRDDLIQEGMIGLYKAVRDYDADKGASFRTFAALCIVRQMNNAIQTSTRGKNRVLNDSVPFPEEEIGAAFLALETASPEHALLDRESAAELMERIQAALSEKEWVVLRYYLQGRSYQEMAEILSCPVKSIDNAIQRIRAKVRKIF